MDISTLEIVGWIATFVVIGSFLVNDMLKLRSINLIGATLWLIYGIIASSYSIIFLNVVVLGQDFGDLAGLGCDFHDSHGLG